MALSPQEIINALPGVRDLRISTQTKVSHSVIVPFATYSPWFDHPGFAQLYAAVRQNTLVDVYRLFELWSLAGQQGVRSGDILEVGVWRGGSGCLMAARAKEVGSTATIFLCDTFEGVVKAGAMDTHYKGGEHADTSAAAVRDLAGKLGLDNIHMLPGIFPDDTGAEIAERRFSLCHIDVDVYGSAQHVLDWVWLRLEPGGVVVFDDYGFATCEGVTMLVNERAPLQDGLALHNLNGHALFIKTGV